MKHSLAACLGLTCLILLGVCPSAPVAAPAERPFPEPLVDAFLKTEIEDRGGELAGDGQAATSESLAKQLDRTSCTLSLPSASTRTHDLPGLFRAAAPGTLVLAKIRYCDDCQRWHAPVCATAFAITADGACVTNYHVFRQVEEGTVIVVADAWGRTYPVLEVLAASRRDDAAIFRVDVGDVPLTPLPLRAGSPVGTAVAVLSNPATHFFSFYPGILSRRAWRFRGISGDMKELSPRESHGDSVDRSSSDKLTPALEITADYGVGASGGPVLDLGGNVVGMVSNTVPVYADPKERRALQMNFHLCVPAESILRLIRDEK